MLLWGLVSGQGRLALLPKVVVDGLRYDNLERLGVIERSRVEHLHVSGEMRTRMPLLSSDWLDGYVGSSVAAAASAVA